MKENGIRTWHKNIRIPQLILVLQNTMAVMGHDDPLLPHSFMVPFLICLLKTVNLITS